MKRVVTIEMMSVYEGKELAQQIEESICLLGLIESITISDPIYKVKYEKRGTESMKLYITGMKNHKDRPPEIDFDYRGATKKEIEELYKLFIERKPILIKINLDDMEDSTMENAV